MTCLKNDFFGVLPVRKVHMKSTCTQENLLVPDDQTALFMSPICCCFNLALQDIRLLKTTKSANDFLPGYGCSLGSPFVAKVIPRASYALSRPGTLPGTVKKNRNGLSFLTDAVHVQHLYFVDQALRRPKK